jgi:uncharacterized protein (TIGR03437 family)
MHRIKSIRTICGFLLTAGVAAAQQYTISTVAGIGTVQGFYGDTGAATSALLDFPLRVAVDSKGNIYIADYLTQVIREVSGGNINTLTGNGTFGFQGDNGPAVQGIISDVHGIAVGPNGNIYFADTHNSRIREIIPGGNIFTVAGNGTTGYSGDGGPATSAQLAQPSGVAVDSAGNVYIADYGNYSVRKVDTKGNITTYAGTGAWGYTGDGGPANKAALAAPYALTFDPAGSLYISDLGNLDIRKVTPDGNIQTVASNIDAESIAVDSAGNIYEPDFRTATLQKILPNGTKYAIAGTGVPGFSGDGGPAIGAQLDQPYGVAIDGQGNIYVADSGNMVIRLLTPVASSLSVMNAASGLGSAIAPGEIVTLYGTGLGPAAGVTATPGANGYGMQLAGTTVSFGGTLGPVLYTSATQVNAIVPYDAPVGGTADVTVSYQGQSFTASAMPVTGASPAVFTSNSTGVGPAAVVNQNGTVNSPVAPAQVGSIVSFYLTGEGQTSPVGIDGKLATAPLPQPQLPVQAFVAGQQTSVTYAGGAPGLVAGLMQVNVVLPAGIIANTSGPIAVPVTLQVGGSLTQLGITVYVSN